MDGSENNHAIPLITVFDVSPQLQDRGRQTEKRYLDFFPRAEVTCVRVLPLGLPRDVNNSRSIDSAWRHLSDTPSVWFPILI